MFGLLNMQSICIYLVFHYIDFFFQKKNAFYFFQKINEKTNIQQQQQKTILMIIFYIFKNRTMGLVAVC